MSLEKIKKARDAGFGLNDMETDWLIKRIEHLQAIVLKACEIGEQACANVDMGIVASYKKIIKELRLRCDRSDVTIDEYGTTTCHCVCCELSDLFTKDIAEIKG